MKRCPPLTAPDLHLALYPLLLGTDMLYLSYLHYLSTCVQPCICGTLVLPAQTFLSLSLLILAQFMLQRPLNTHAAGSILLKVYDDDRVQKLNLAMLPGSWV